MMAVYMIWWKCVWYTGGVYDIMLLCYDGGVWWLSKSLIFDNDIQCGKFKTEIINSVLLGGKQKHTRLSLAWK